MRYPFLQNKALLYFWQALIELDLIQHHQALIDKAHKKQMSDNTALAKKIADAIEASGMKAREVADRCEVTPQAVNGWKTTGRIKKEMLSVLAGVLGVPLEYFIPPTVRSEAERHLKVVHLPKSRDTVSGESVMRLIALYVQSTDDGRKSLLEFAELTPKVLSARTSANDKP